MDELQLYGDEGLFHQVVKQSAVFNGRYGVLPKGGTDLNLNNILSGIEFPKEKYPGVFCVPPLSELPATVQQAPWECFYFRIFFLCTTNSTGDNKIKSPDPSTNTSLHTVPMDWSDMKTLALNFMNALEKIQKPLIKQFRLKQREPWKIVRLSKVQNDNLSGVMLQFQGEISTPCAFTDIDIDGTGIMEEIIAGIAPAHETHFH
jgi:hypothetical protein